MSAHTPGPCEAGHCDKPSTVDFGKYIRVVGIQGPISGKVRYLCDHHARGIKRPDDVRPRSQLTRTLHRMITKEETK